MPAFRNTTSDRLEFPTLGITVDAGATVELTDAQAAALSPSHPLLSAVPAAPVAPPAATPTPVSVPEPTTPAAAPAVKGA
ncbi:hypothetical protein [Haloactinopolyspora sp.]|uniref:hypothetical protein n=1 Tax=Haloactinopolyspora sp. TaxID=1966353 RepID=UPI00260BA87C|nr:hypothetical protein [Haloactinopolyspora sp.]